MQRGERQTARSKEAIIQAFRHLVRAQSYESITIEEISAQANVGRSTFYRHFASKADLLLGVHQEVFAQFSDFYTSAEQWLAETPSPAVVHFLQQLQIYNRTNNQRITTLSLAQFGNDIDYLVRRINELLATAFAHRLQQAFASQTSTIPLPVLAQSLAGTYSWVLQAWLNGQLAMNGAEVAVYLQRLVRATISEALPTTQEQPATIHQ